MAKPVEREGGVTQLLQTKCGTPLYQALEFFKEDVETGTELYDKSIDIFGAGRSFIAFMCVKENEHIEPILGEYTYASFAIAVAHLVI